LCLPVIAPRSRAACRAPNNDRSQPASRSATDNPNQVIEVGCATAITPGISASRLLSDRNPAKVGCTLKPVRPHPTLHVGGPDAHFMLRHNRSIDPDPHRRGGSLPRE
jgi:hypothetical protein